MRAFMDYLQHAFYDASGWDPNNTYSSLNATAQSLLFFETPHGLRLNVSALSSPNAASSYEIGHVGLINGSLSYLYTSLPLQRPSKSSQLDLGDFVPGYRHVRDLEQPERARGDGLLKNEPRERPDTLLYGRLYLPRSTLEAMYLRRLSPTRQIQLSYVSDSTLNNAATLLALYQHEYGKLNTEYLYSTDSALVGFRGLYNFGEDQTGESSSLPTEQRNGRLSAGGEVYYGLLNKSGGISGGLRFTTLPQHAGFPYTMKLTMNPLMGNLSSSYAVKAGRNLALCSQFDFNFYSYESGLRLGLELWRMRQQYLDTGWARRLLRPGWKQPAFAQSEDVSGVLKARWDQNWRVGILWEGRIKEILFSLGVTLDMRRRDQIFRAVGAELHFSS